MLDIYRSDNITCIGSLSQKHEFELDIELKLGLMNESSQVELKLLDFLTSSSSNIICGVGLSLSQVSKLHIFCQSELKHSILNKT